MPCGAYEELWWSRWVLAAVHEVKDPQTQLVDRYAPCDLRRFLSRTFSRRHAVAITLDAGAAETCVKACGYMRTRGCKQGPGRHASPRPGSRRSWIRDNNTPKENSRGTLAMNYWRQLGAILASSVIFASSTARAADAPPSGSWDAGIVVNGVLIPFRLELS